MKFVDRVTVPEHESDGAVLSIQRKVDAEFLRGRMDCSLNFDIHLRVSVDDPRDGSGTDFGGSGKIEKAGFRRFHLT